MNALKNTNANKSTLKAVITHGDHGQSATQTRRLSMWLRPSRPVKVAGVQVGTTYSFGTNSWIFNVDAEFAPAEEYSILHPNANSVRLFAVECYLNKQNTKD